MMVNKLNLQDSVIFCGVQEHTELYYNAMDCFVLPSLYEGLPVVGVEAQANGLPCFFSKSTTKEIIINKNAYRLKLGEFLLKISKITFSRDVDNIINNSNFYINNAVNYMTKRYFSSLDKLIIK